MRIWTYLICLIIQVVVNGTGGSRGGEEVVEGVEEVVAVEGAEEAVEVEEVVECWK